MKLYPSSLYFFDQTTSVSLHCPQNWNMPPVEVDRFIVLVMQLDVYPKHHFLHNWSCFLSRYSTKLLDSFSLGRIVMHPKTKLASSGFGTNYFEVLLNFNRASMRLSPQCVLLQTNVIVNTRIIIGCHWISFHSCDSIKLSEYSVPLLKHNWYLMTTHSISFIHVM